MYKNLYPDGFEWDDVKNRANRAKHRIDFETASLVFEGPTLTSPDDRETYGEARFLTIGQAGGAVVLVVWTPRRRKVRIISARKASRHERQVYEEVIAKAQQG